MSRVQIIRDCVKGKTESYPPYLGLNEQPPMAPIAELVSQRLGIDLEAMRGQERWQAIMAARHIAIWLGRRTGCGLSHMGRYMRRDHSTIRYAYWRIEQWRLRDETICWVTDRLLAEIRLSLANGLQECISGPLTGKRKSKPPDTQKTETAASDALNEEQEATYRSWGGLEFLQRQNARFAAAMQRAGERP